jgi:hypothetical protein
VEIKRVPPAVFALSAHPDWEANDGGLAENLKNGMSPAAVATGSAVTTAPTASQETVAGTPKRRSAAWSTFRPPEMQTVTLVPTTNTRPEDVDEGPKAVCGATGATGHENVFDALRFICCTAPTVVDWINMDVFDHIRSVCQTRVPPAASAVEGAVAQISRVTDDLADSTMAGTMQRYHVAPEMFSSGNVMFIPEPPLSV